VEELVLEKKTYNRCGMNLTKQFIFQLVNEMLDKKMEDVSRQNTLKSK